MREICHLGSELSAHRLEDNSIETDVDVLSLRLSLVALSLLGMRWAEEAL